MKNVIEINNLSFGYDKSKTVLNDISLAIEEGTINVILGKNGSGKSTLMNCILGLNEYKYGTIKIFDTNLKELSHKEIAKSIAYVSQIIEVGFDFSVLEYICFGRNCHLKYGIAPSEEDYDIARRYAKICGVEDLLDKAVNKLSGGERQLVCFARAMAQETPIIVMDEPTSALDVSNQHLVLNELKQVVEKYNKTIVISSHNPNNALYLNAQVVLLDKGRILSFGKANEIIRVEMLKQIYGDSICYVDDLPYKEISFK